MGKIKRIVIAGGGTAGWMTAAAMGKLLNSDMEITLIESDAIPTIGVGEATIPSLHIFHRLLGVDERQFMSATNATFKLGISFENWAEKNKSYIHSFGLIGRDTWACGFHNFWLKGQSLGLCSELGDYIPEHLAAREGRYAVHPQQEQNYSYHLDAGLYAKFLQGIAENNNVKRIEGTIKAVQLDNDTGHIQSLNLDSGQIVEGDLFIDCTGFRALLIEKALHTGYDDWSHLLPCDSAVAVQTTSVGTPPAYTRSIARDSGWQWRIPLQNRTGNGLVFCSNYLSDDEAVATLLANVDGETLNEPRVIKYKTGTRRAHWTKNCIAVGLSGGFIEPLESTGIHLFQRAIVRLLQFFPKDQIHQTDIDEFNRLTKVDMDHIKDFIVLHYHLTQRTDTPFWRYCKNMDIPDTLCHRMQVFENSGRVPKAQGELFGEPSWVQVMMGQGLQPSRYHPVVDRMTEADLGAFLNSVKDSVRNKVDAWPNHFDFVRQYCKSSF